MGITMSAESEASFQSRVVKTAHHLGWRTFAVRRSAAVSAKTGKVVSYVTSEGWPDLVLVKGNKIIFWELKSDRGEIEQEQHEWLTALEAVETVHQVGCVRPRDFDLIEATLRGER